MAKPVLLKVRNFQDYSSVRDDVEGNLRVPTLMERRRFSRIANEVIFLSVAESFSFNLHFKVDLVAYSF